ADCQDRRAVLRSYLDHRGRRPARPAARTRRTAMTIATLFKAATGVRVAALALALAGAMLTAALPRAAHPAPTLFDHLPHEMVTGLDLSGRWRNEGEEVVLTHVGSSVTGIAFYTEGGTGSYEGCFDPATRTFYMEYENAVDDGYGQLTLSVDGTMLNGY